MGGKEGKGGKDRRFHGVEDEEGERDSGLFF